MITINSGYRITGRRATLWREKNVMPEIRWHAVAYYRYEKGTVDIHHDLEELFELHDLIEHGPHWDTIEKIEIARVNHDTDEKLTVEQSMKL